MRLMVTVLTLLLLFCMNDAKMENNTENTETTLRKAGIMKRNLTEKMEELANYLSESVQLVRGIEARFMQIYRKDKWLKTNKTGLPAFGNGGGAVFTRWGNDTCSDETELAYNGFATSGHFSHTGAGTNLLCANGEPQFERTFPGNTSKPNYLHGAEYEGIWRSDLTNQDVPCAVCRSGTRSSAIMVPGIHDCMKGWYTEYWGFLVGPKHDDPGNSEYICLDSDPDSIEGGYQSHDGRTLYNVRAICGTLPCPPYKGGYHVPCAVCTK